MTGFAILLLAAAIAFGLAKFLRLPPIPLLMLSGVALRLAVETIGIQLETELLNETIQIGLAALVFTAGVELSPRRIQGRFKPVLIIAVAEFLTLGACGLITALALGYDTTTALYIACALSASSTLVVVRHLQKRRQLFEPFGRLVLGILLLQDLFIILLMVALIKAPEGLWIGCFSVIKTIGLGVFAFALHQRFIPWIAEHMKLDDEELMLGALGMLFAFSGMAHLLDVPYLVGAFFAGFTLSAFPMNGLVRGMLGSLTGFFLALFFIGIGAVLTLPSLEMLGHSILFILILIVATVVVVALVAEAVGYSTRVAIETGLLLSQTSEFSLVLAFAGMVSGQISQELFSMVVLITVTTMTLTPAISRETIAWSLMRRHPKHRKGEGDCETMTDHAVLLGYGRAGPSTVQTLKEHGVNTIVIDDDAGVIRQLIAKNIRCIQGDGSDQRILERANAREARVVICSVRRMTDAQLALNFLKDHKPKVIVRTFEANEAESIRKAGGYPVQTANASAEIFTQWFRVNFPKNRKNEP